MAPALGALTTFQLDFLLRSHPVTKTSFIGTFACDQRVEIPSWRPFSLIFNTDDSSCPGSHWIAIFSDKLNRDRPEYFDSTGMLPATMTKKWLNQFKFPFISSKRRVQPFKSDMCGYYCLYFIHQRCRGRTLNSIFSSFSADLDSNDRMIGEWFQREWIFLRGFSRPHSTSDVFGRA